MSPECAQELAEIFEIRPFEVMEVVSFYNMFYATPQPRHQVRVCTNLPCSLRGARELLHRLEAHLGVEDRRGDGRRPHPPRPRGVPRRLRLRADDARRSAIPRRSRRRAAPSASSTRSTEAAAVLKAPYVTGYLTRALRRRRLRHARRLREAWRLPGRAQGARRDDTGSRHRAGEGARACRAAAAPASAPASSGPSCRRPATSRSISSATRTSPSPARSRTAS